MPITIRHIHTLDPTAVKLVQRLIDGTYYLAESVNSLAIENRNLASEVATLADNISQLSAPSVIIIVSGQSIHVPGLQQGEDMSYTVERDHQNEPFTLDPITASDSEGPVETTFTERLESSDESIVAVSGSEFVFGTFGGATVNRIVTHNGNDFIVASVVFNVTPGALTFSGGGVTVAGLTPDVEPEPEPAPEA